MPKITSAGPSFPEDHSEDEGATPPGDSGELYMIGSGGDVHGAAGLEVLKASAEGAAADVPAGDAASPPEPASPVAPRVPPRRPPSKASPDG